MRIGGQISSVEWRAENGNPIEGLAFQAFGSTAGILLGIDPGIIQKILAILGDLATISDRVERNHGRPVAVTRAVCRPESKSTRTPQGL